MSFNKKRILSAIIITAIVLSVSGCGNKNNNTTNDTANSSQSEISSESETTVEDNATSKISSSNNSGAVISDSGIFSKRDLDASYDESSAVSITLADNNIICNSKNVSVSDNTVTITKEGVYILTGTLKNGRVVIDSANTDKIQLILNGVNVNCDTSAPLYVKQADKVFVSLAGNSENILSNAKEFVAVDENNIDSVIFSKDDLTFNGTGQLTVNAKYGHGIVSKDDLVFAGGVYNVTAQNHSLTGNDAIKIADGTFSLTAGKDGLHAENTDDVEKGIVYIENGNIKITSDGDGIDSSATFQLVDGNVDVTTGGGSENAEKKQEELFGRGGFDRKQENIQQEESTSVKGIKSSGNMSITGGTVNINSVDDALHSNSDMTIDGGNITISSGDDGLHADSNMIISNGVIKITNSYEGIEGQTIEISGGTTTLVASDDGLNSAGGNDESGYGGGMKQDIFAVDENSYIKISDGTLTVDASGDGIDSNGSLSITGGATYVTGPSNGGNGTLDYASTAEITGGVFVGVGASGMAQNFGNSSTQGAMLVNTSASVSEGDVLLKDSNEKVLVSFSPTRPYNSVIVSCPEITENQTYTLTANGSDTTIEMTSLIYDSDSMGRNPMGGGPMGGGPMGGGPMGDPREGMM